MTICPIAIAVGCKKCPVFSICPATRVLGDQAAPAASTTAAADTPKKSGGNQRGRGHAKAKRAPGKGSKRPRKA